MWPGRVSNPGPLTYESGALPTALRGPATIMWEPHGLLTKNAVRVELSTSDTCMVFMSAFDFHIFCSILINGLLEKFID